MPSSRRALANFCAKGASYSITGVIACSPGMISKPALVISERKSFVFSANLSTRCVLSVNNSNTFIEAPTIDGANVFENK